MFFFKHHAEHEAGKLVLDLFFVFLKLYRRSKQVLSNLVLIYFGITSLRHFTLLIQRYAQFFYKKGAGLASPPHFVYYFSRKVFEMLYSIN